VTTPLTFAGPVALSADPTLVSGPATKKYVDAQAKTFLPVANGTHFNGNGANASTSLIQTRCRQTRKLLRVLVGGADTIQVEWANIWTSCLPQSAGASSEIAGVQAVTARMSIEYPAGNPRQVSGSTAYASGTAYAVFDQVTSGGSAWVCIQAGTGQTPASGSAFWRQVNRYVVNWEGQTDTSGTVVFNTGDYKKSMPITLSEKMRQGDCIAVYGAFDTGSSTGYIPYAGANGACNTVPFVDWVVDASTGLPAVGSALPDTGIVAQTNGNTTTANSTVNTSWMKIPYATAITGNIPTKKCIALFGDSVMQGFGGDIRDGEPCGFFARAVDGTSWWRIAQPGVQAGCYLPGNYPWQSSVISRCSSVITYMAINDLNQGLTLAQMKSVMQNHWVSLSQTGVPIYSGYLIPVSASSDAWATTANQSRYTASGTIATTQYPTDDASYLTSIYGQVAMWLSQSGASMTTPDGATVQAGQKGHPVDALLDFRGLLADPQTSWKWTAGLTTDGGHPNALAVGLQSAYLARQMEPLLSGRQVPPGFRPYLPLGEAVTRSMDRSLVRDLAAQATGSLMSVAEVSPGAMFYGFRMWPGSAVGSRSYTVLVGADAAKMKVLQSGTLTTVANTLVNISLTGAPIWIPAGYLMAVVVTSPAASSWYGLNAASSLLNITGYGFCLAGNSTDTAVLSGTATNLYSVTAGAAAFAGNAARLFVEFY
jgi:hypothetical protein